MTDDSTGIDRAALTTAGLELMNLGYQMVVSGGPKGNNPNVLGRGWQKRARFPHQPDELRPIAARVLTCPFLRPLDNRAAVGAALVLRVPQDHAKGRDRGREPEIR